MEIEAVPQIVENIFIGNIAYYQGGANDIPSDCTAKLRISFLENHALNGVHCRFMEITDQRLLTTYSRGTMHALAALSMHPPR